MYPRSWRQINVTFFDWDKAEHTAVTHLAPLLASAEADLLITSWFFMRKIPCWRLRYVPRSSRAFAYMRRHLDDLQQQGHIANVTELVYEPEVHAFGGVEAMQCAHDLFHLDSRHLLAYLASSPRIQRRELSILLCTIMMRAARLDWYEQGDVWARVAEHRDLPARIPTEQRDTLETSVRRLMSVDITALLHDGALKFAAEWSEAFSTTGRDLDALAARGRLQRGLRAVLAHHVIFAWNRLGMPYTAQAILAHTAKHIVFGREADQPRSQQR
jgi:thiopeptide-type bacteriocin biosynthesis protein